MSSIVDNVPLVAATQGMYDLNTYPTDHYFWEFIAYTTGTGGSILIIGSASGRPQWEWKELVFSGI